MADLTLRIKADFDEAQHAFLKVAASSDNAAEKVHKFSQSFKAESADKFIDRQGMAAAAMIATGREADILNTQTKAYQKEIERLISAGLTPQDEAMQKLQSKYAELVVKQAEAAQVSNELSEAAQKIARENERLVETTIKLMNAENEHEKAIINLTSEKERLTNEIKELIKQGISPENEAVRKLKKELDNANDGIRAHEDAVKKAEKALRDKEKAVEQLNQVLTYFVIKALKTAIDGTSEFIKKSAEAGDAFAKTANIIGMTAEEYQELEYAAKQSGLSGDQLKGSLQKLNKSMADLKVGSGALHKYLSDNNAALLENVKNAKTNEQAFMLLMDAIKNSPDEFQRAALAQAAFGKSGHELIIMAQQGEGGIAALRDEARKYGIISNEAAAQSEKFMDAQMRLQAAFQGVGYEIAEVFQPVLTNALQKAADFIAGIDDWDRVLKLAAVALGTTATALTAFVVISKSHAIVTAMSVAIKGLMAAVTGPAGIAAAAIIGLGSALGLIVNHQSKMKTANVEVSNSIREQSSQADRLINAYERLNPQKTIDKNLTEALLRIYPQLTGKIKENVTSIEELNKIKENLMLEEAEKNAAPFAIEMIKNYREMINLQKRYNEATPITRPVIGIDLNKATKKYEEFRDKVNEIFKQVDKKVTSIDPIELTYKINDTAEKSGNKIISEALSGMESSAGEIITLTQKLNEKVEMTTAQKNGDMIRQVVSFLNQRSDLEQSKGNNRIAAIEREAKRIIEIVALESEERIAVEKAAAQLIEDTKKQITVDAAQEAKKKSDEEKTRLQNLLTAQGETEAQAGQERLNQFAQFLQARFDAEQLKGDEAVQWLEKHGKEMAEIEGLTDKEREAAALAAEKAIADYKKQFSDEEEERLKENEGRQKEYMDRLIARTRAIIEPEKTAHQERAEMFEQFMQSKLDAEELGAAASLALLRQQYSAIMADENMGYGERLAAQDAFLKLYNKAEKAAAEERKAIIQETTGQLLSAMGSLADVSLNIQQTALDERVKGFDDAAKKELKAHDDKVKEELKNEALTKTQKKALEEAFSEQRIAIEEKHAKNRQRIIDAANEKARGAAIAQRMVASAEATVHTYLAASKALSAGPPPWNFIQMGAVIASGLANVLKINTTPIPTMSAETGGTFVVPNTGRVDGTLVRVNQGETLDVTPRGMAHTLDNKIITVNLMWDNRILATAINDLADSGKLHRLGKNV